MKKIICIIAMIFLLSLLIGCSVKENNKEENLKELTKVEKIEDFDYYISTMKENYCNFDVFYNNHNIEYLDLYEILKEEIENSKDNKEFYNIMNTAINLLGDGHTNLIAPSSVEWFKNRYGGTYQGDILNDSVIAKNKKWEAYLNEDDYLQNINMKINEKIYDPNKANIETKIIDNEIAYLKINSFNEFNWEDSLKIRDLYKDINNYEDYIIDIRGNGGGNNQLWMDYIINPIVDEKYESITYSLHKGGKITKDYYKHRGRNLKDIEGFPDKDMLKNVDNVEDYKYYSEYKTYFSNGYKEGYKGNIYLLVDKGVFSSSEALTVFCKDSGWATVVGNENSGGDGIGIDPIVFKLPNSDLVVRSTAEKGLNPDGSSNLENGTELDLYMNSLEDLVEHIKSSN